MAPSPRQPLPAELKRIRKLQRKGKMPEEVADMLVGRGWSRDDALDVAEAEDRKYQDQMREDNMGVTHGKRDMVRTGGGAIGAITAIYFGFKLFRFFVRWMAE